MILNTRTFHPNTMRFASVVLVSGLLLASCAPAQNGSDATTAETETVTARWKMQPDTVRSTEQTPYTTLSLVIDRADGTINDVALGSFMGSGSVIGMDSAWEIPKDSKSAVMFWMAGGGDQVALMQEGTTLIVNTRTVDEESGMGEWKELKRIALPDGTRVNVQ